MKDLTKTLGQIGYEAYGDKVRWQTPDNQEVLGWCDTRIRTQEAWEYAAWTVSEQAATSIEG